MTIKIITRLDSGIASTDAGQARTHYTWKTGPRNLIKAIESLSSHRQRMIASYGNIGCGGSWIEVDGVRLSYDDMMKFESVCVFADMSAAEYDREFRTPRQTRTEWAKEMLTKIEQVPAAIIEAITDSAAAEWLEINTASPEAVELYAINGMDINISRELAEKIHRTITA